mmetsp:Transcript_53947/g.156730  ORF Transcript_53947/g.156730 Transcript_53947/m.156730 type:complete len:225 (-) Transcript_53947:21-695(-)
MRGEGVILLQQHNIRRGSRRRRAPALRFCGGDWQKVARAHDFSEQPGPACGPAVHLLFFRHEVVEQLQGQALRQLAPQHAAQGHGEDVLAGLIDVRHLVFSDKGDAGQCRRNVGLALALLRAPKPPELCVVARRHVFVEMAVVLWRHTGPFPCSPICADLLLDLGAELRASRHHPWDAIRAQGFRQHVVREYQEAGIPGRHSRRPHSASEANAESLDKIMRAKD